MTFKAGKSGNPNGRPKGVRDSRAALRDVIESNQEVLLQTALHLALSGNEQMLKLLLERVLPARPREEPVAINLLSLNLVEQSQAIIKAVTDGKITVTDAESLMRTVSVESKIYEAEVLKKDVEEMMRLVKKE